MLLFWAKQTSTKTCPLSGWTSFRTFSFSGLPSLAPKPIVKEAQHLKAGATEGTEHLQITIVSRICPPFGYSPKVYPLHWGNISSPVGNDNTVSNNCCLYLKRKKIVYSSVTHF